VAPHAGISIVKRRSGLNSTSRPNSKLLALAVVTAAALALGGCGRKAGLDLPPGAAAAPGGEALSTDTPRPGTSAAQGNVFSTVNPNDRTQYAPKMPPKRIILDPILD
jgi:predicted small lipoprotein YifL